jgi:hypothetical protein
MLRRISLSSKALTAVTGAIALSIALSIAGGAFAQQSEGAGKQTKAKGEKKGPARPPLFLREEWKQAPGAGEQAVGQVNVASPSLELKLYGSSGKEFQVAGAPGDENNPLHLWTGLCATVCSAALRDKNNYADLTGLAKIRWVTKVSGFHKVHPIVKLADGTWLAGDFADGSMVDWHESEFSLSEVRWLKFDADRGVTVGNFVEKPDLSKVDEIGFSDLMPASGHGPGGWSDVAKIEVWAKSVSRN